MESSISDESCSFSGCLKLPALCHVISKIQLTFVVCTKYLFKFRRKLHVNVLCLLQSKCADMKFNILDDHATGTKASFVDVNYSKLETELKDYVIKQEVCACAQKH